MTMIEDAVAGADSRVERHAFRGAISRPLEDADAPGVVRKRRAPTRRPPVAFVVGDDLTREHDTLLPDRGRGCSFCLDALAPATSDSPARRVLLIVRGSSASPRVAPAGDCWFRRGA